MVCGVLETYLGVLAIPIKAQNYGEYVGGFKSKFWDWKKFHLVAPQRIAKNLAIHEKFHFGLED